METKFIEAMNRVSGQPFNWGKFMVARFTDEEEWRRRSHMPDDDPDSEMSGFPLLARVGWGHEHIMVLDLQTGEGALFRHGGLASNDLNEKHQLWVCPLYEPFLEWLYRQDVRDLSKLPDIVELDAPAAMSGYRRDRGGKGGKGRVGTVEAG